MDDSFSSISHDSEVRRRSATGTAQARYKKQVEEAGIRVTSSAPPKVRRDIMQPIKKRVNEKLIVLPLPESLVKNREPSCAGASLPVCALDRKSTRLNSSHSQISYAVFCLKK